MKINDLFKTAKIANDTKITSTATPATKTPIKVFRDAVEKQIDLIKFDIDPDQWREHNTDEEGNIKKDPEGRKWYKVDTTGAYTFIKYGVKKVALSSTQKPGSMALNVGTTFEDIETFYENLLKVIDAGEITNRINKVAIDMINERQKTKQSNLEKAAEEEKTDTE